jgi:hypothetical protein
VSRVAAALVVLLALGGCTAEPKPVVTLEPGVPVDCGPLVDPADCVRAATVAATAKLNPPPVSAVRIRRPVAGDDCLTQFHPCDADDVIVSIQSGDTLQDVLLARTTNGWLRLDLIR